MQRYISGAWTGAMYDAMGSDGSRGDMFPMAALLKVKHGTVVIGP